LGPVEHNQTSLKVTGSNFAPRKLSIAWIPRSKIERKSFSKSLAYYPFDVSEPTNRVSRALSRGSRRMDLSSHYLLELERLGAPYRIIWTRDEGCVDRPIITPKKRRSKHVLAMKLPDADAFTDSFRARCASLPPLLPPKLPLYRGPLTRCRIPSGLPFWTTNIMSWILHTAFAFHLAN
jgi:hypothetical protein